MDRIDEAYRGFDPRLKDDPIEEVECEQIDLAEFWLNYSMFENELNRAMVDAIGIDLDSYCMELENQGNNFDDYFEIYIYKTYFDGYWEEYEYNSTEIIVIPKKNKKI